MIRTTSDVLRAVGRGFVAVADRLVAPAPSPKQLMHARWLAANGDKTLRLDYPLTRDSTVLDVGGYEGQWASDIFSRYLCRIHIFEPVPEFADRIARRFAANDQIKLHRLALGNRHGEVTLTVAGDASSAYLKGGQQVTVRVASPQSVFESERINEADLLKVNSEGAEYDLLENLIATRLIERIRQLQIQFHDFVPDAEVRMGSIQRALARTHSPTYQFPFLWENWRRKDLAA